ncbi:MAG: phosphopantetheine-binding protein [Desulfobacterales bacterium]|nr:phosphopantetheine-binding protein [Desulfobacterales bacterium]
MDLYTEIKQMIVKGFALDGQKVVPEAHLEDDLGGDSLAMMNLAEAIAMRYGIEVKIDDLGDIGTVAELVKWVELKISPTHSA